VTSLPTVSGSAGAMVSLDEAAPGHHIGRNRQRRWRLNDPPALSTARYRITVEISLQKEPEAGFTCGSLTVPPAAFGCDDGDRSVTTRLLGGEVGHHDSVSDRGL
jgi:hypothetical protein